MNIEMIAAIINPSTSNETSPDTSPVDLITKVSYKIMYKYGKTFGLSFYKLTLKMKICVNIFFSENNSLYISFLQDITTK